MKFNKALLICSMVIISLLAVGAVSASEDISDVVEISDVEDVETIETGVVDEIVEDDGNSDDEVLSVEEPEATDDLGEAIVSDEPLAGEGDTSGQDNPDNPATTDNPMQNMMGNGSFGDMGGMGDMSQYMNMNMSSFMGMFGDMDMGSLMGMFGMGGSSTIKAKNLNKYYAKKTSYKVTLLDSSNKPLSGKYVVFTINNKEYNVKTNSKGVATLKLKLNPGKYYVMVEYDNTIVKKQIKIKNVLITKNLVKKANKLGKFKVKVLNSKGKAYAKRTVKISFRGKTTKIKTNKKGIATFKVSKNLKKGKYTIKTIYNGLTRKNKITVK